MVSDQSVPPASPEQPEQRGQMMILPVYLREAMTVTAALAYPSPWGAPLLWGMKALREDGQPVVVIMNESPINALRPVEPMDKRQVELMHIQRLAVDAMAATGQELFVAIEQPADDPPDVLVHHRDGTVGAWELTALRVGSRRVAHALFNQVRAQLAIQQRGRLAHLTGHFVYMWFGSADDPLSLPYRRNDEAALSELVESLVAYRPDPDELRVDGPAMPARIDNFNPVHGPGDVTYYAVPLLNAVPTSPLFCLAGMEVGLAFQSEHNAADEWANLRAQVAAKDVPANAVLLVSAGAPDTHGQQFIAEEVLADLLVEHHEPLHAEHLQAVVVHFWSTGRAVNILGDAATELWPAIYSGVMPSSQPFLPAEPSAPTA